MDFFFEIRVGVSQNVEAVLQLFSGFLLQIRDFQLEWIWDLDLHQLQDIGSTCVFPIRFLPPARKWLTCK